jgi:uncharacterized membrane protein YjfL (UPF0719 family)
MEWPILALNFFYAAMGVILMFVAYRLIDRLTPEVNFADQLNQGNMAVGVVIAAIFVAVAMVVAAALN